MPTIVPDYQAANYQIMDNLAGKVIRKLNSLDLTGDFADLRPEIAATYVAAVMLGTEAVSYLTAEQYDQLRKAAGVTDDDFRADTLTIDRAKVIQDGKQIAYQALRHDDAETIGREVAGKMAQAIRDHGFGTTAHNVGRDPKMVGVNSRYTITLTCNERQCAKKNKPEWQCANVAEAIKDLAPATAHTEAEKPDHWFHPGCRCTIKPNWISEFGTGRSRFGGTVEGKTQWADGSFSTPRHAAKSKKSTAQNAQQTMMQLKSEFHRRGIPVTGKFDASDMALVKNRAEALFKILDAHPEWAPQLGAVEFTKTLPDPTYKNAVAWTSYTSRTMTFNLNSTEMGTVGAQGKNWWHADPSTDYASYVVTHEFGHLLDYATGLTARHRYQEGILDSILNEEVARMGGDPVTRRNELVAKTEEWIRQRANDLGLISDYSAYKETKPGPLHDSPADAFAEGLAAAVYSTSASSAELNSLTIINDLLRGGTP